ncbi:MAG: hypothetical protein K0S42_2476, partial [Microvirga sp.]|nr:hypothetical protein [Microvirga sp.]
MAQKIRGSLSDPQFAEFCERLRSMPGGR